MKSQHTETEGHIARVVREVPAFAAAKASNPPGRWAREAAAVGIERLVTPHARQAVLECGAEPARRAEQLQ